MYKKAKSHFRRVDPVLYAAALEFDIADLVASEELLRDIAWTIIGQQLSGKAADTIFARFKKLFPKGVITPRRILALTDEALRSVGLSGAKARAIRNLAEAVASGELDLKRLPERSNEQVLAELTKIKGIGPWTAEMILMFSLGREDVFSRGDLGLRKGIQQLYGLRAFPSEKRLRKITDAWSPYRTYAARVLWKLADKKSMRIPRKRG